MTKTAGHSLAPMGDAPSQQVNKGTKIKCPNCEFPVDPMLEKQNHYTPMGGMQNSVNAKCPRCKNDFLVKSTGETDKDGKTKLIDPTQQSRPLITNPNQISNKINLASFLAGLLPTASDDKVLEVKKIKDQESLAAEVEPKQSLCPKETSACPFEKDLKTKEETKPTYRDASSDSHDTVKQIGIENGLNVTVIPILDVMSLSEEARRKLAEAPCRIMSQKAKENLAVESSIQDKKIQATAAMYPQVIQKTPGLCQWCPKLKQAVSMEICANHCSEGRRIPKKSENGQVYKNFMMSGGDDDGKTECNLKRFMNDQLEAYYPGFIEDRVRAKNRKDTANDVYGKGGEVVQDTTSRKLNIPDGKRGIKPRYPDEKLVEKQFEVENRHRHAGEIVSGRIAKAQVAAPLPGTEMPTDLSQEMGAPIEPEVAAEPQVEEVMIEVTRERPKIWMARFISGGDPEITGHSAYPKVAARFLISKARENGVQVQDGELNVVDASENKITYRIIDETPQMIGDETPQMSAPMQPGSEMQAAPQAPAPAPQASPIGY